MGPLSNNIGKYRDFTESAMKKLDGKENLSLHERSAHQILSAEINNLDSESKLLEEARKTTPFVKFLKAVGLALTSPIWILPYLIKKLFVKEKSQEQRIRDTLMNIFPHLDVVGRKDLAKVLSEKDKGQIAQLFKGELVEVPSGQPVEKIRELIKDGGLESPEVLKQGFDDLSEHVEKRMKEYFGESIVVKRASNRHVTVQENKTSRQVLEVSFIVGDPPLGVMVARREITTSENKKKGPEQPSSKLRVIDSYSALSGMQKGFKSAYQEARTDAEFKGVPARQKQLLFTLQEFPGKTERSSIGEEVVRGMWRGEKVTNTPTVVTATFSDEDLKVEQHETKEPITKSVNIPWQMFRDLERVHGLKIAGQSVLTSAELKNYNIDAGSLKAARIVKEVSHVEKAIGEAEAHALFRVIAQGLWGDITGDLIKQPNNTIFGQSDYLNVLESGMLNAVGQQEVYNFWVDGQDNIHVSVLRPYQLKAVFVPGVLDNVTVGKIMVKREIIVPRGELAAIGKKKATDAPSLKVIDTYSKVYKELDDDLVESFHRKETVS